MTTPSVLQCAGIGVLGLVAGVVGGLAGIGGSIIIIPGLHVLFPGNPSSIHHLFMAGAMVVNVIVAVPASMRHAKAGAVRRDLLPAAIGAASVAMIAGVLASNHVNVAVLQTLLGVSIVLYCAHLTHRTIRPARAGAADSAPAPTPATWRVVVSAALAGLYGGLLGLGGGLVLVPMLQSLARVGLRQAIATSSTVICVTAAIGSSVKLATLERHGQSVGDALLLAALLAPTAIIGARLGAALTHSLPLRWVRVAIIALMLASAAKLLGAW